MNEIQKVKQFPSTVNIDNLSLGELASAANREANLGDEAFVKGLQHYRACGEYLIAAKAKGKAENGTSWRWSEWLKENWKKSHRLAQTYMQLANKWEKAQGIAGFSDDVGLETAMKLIAIQPETVDVEVIEKEVIKEVEKKVVEKIEVEKPGMIPKSELEKVKKELEQANQRAENIASQNAKLSNQLNKTPQQVTVIDNSLEIRVKELEKLLPVVEKIPDKIEVEVSTLHFSGG